MTGRNQTTESLKILLMQIHRTVCKHTPTLSKQCFSLLLRSYNYSSLSLPPKHVSLTHFFPLHYAEEISFIIPPQFSVVESDHLFSGRLHWVLKDYIITSS